MNEQWVKHPTILTGETVDLIPLEKEHFDELFIAASDKELWKFFPSDCSVRETFDKSYSAAINDRGKGTCYPFVVYHKESGKLIGATRFLDIVSADKKLEIGFTWLGKQYWGTGINFECKLLLLTHCFTILKAKRIQIKTDENNIRSRKAIEKIGGQFEGILRKDRIRENGTSRNTAYYSIIDEEWPVAEQRIKSQLYEHRRATRVLPE
jgi:RimJ/RimL family protein N-acetyltransferase